MINCALIDFKNINTYNFNYQKNDYIENYLLDNDIDILFITNYINYSLDIDVEDYNDNVFYSEIEDNYIIYKGILHFNVCNIILVKNIYNFNIDTKYYSDFLIQPLSIYSYYHGIRLICLDENTRKSNKNSIKSLFTNNTIIGGIFDTKNEKLYNENDKIILSNNSYYGMLFKRFYSNTLAVVKSKYFDNSIINCKCIKDSNIFINSINKLTSLF
tara:strand:- start:1067 stop:1711 length:645 start_codon:yes stop_codon:yes gene_type:complete